MQCTRGALCCVFAYRVHRHRHAVYTWVSLLCVHRHRHVVYTWGSLLCVHLPCSQTQTCSVHVGLSAVCSHTQTCSVHVGLSAVCSQTQTCSVHVGLSAVCSPTVFTDTDMQCTRGSLCCVFAYRVHRHRHVVYTWGSLLYVHLPCSQTQTCSVHVGLSAVCSPTVFTDTDMQCTRGALCCVFTYRVHRHRHVVYTWGSLLCVHRHRHAVCTWGSLLCVRLLCSQTQTCSVHVGLSAVCSPTVFTDTDMQCARGALCCVFAYRVHRHRHAVYTWGSLLYVRLPCSHTQTCSVHVGLSAVCSPTVFTDTDMQCAHGALCCVFKDTDMQCTRGALCCVFTDTDMQCTRGALCCVFTDTDM